MPALYLLGIGGPEDESGIGRVETFVWRFGVVEGRDGSDGGILLAFRSMPRLMAFTRALNGREPFTVPTEAIKLSGAELVAVPYRVAIDPTEADFGRWMALGGRLAERRIEALGG